MRKGEKESRQEGWGHLQFRGLKASTRGTPIPKGSPELGACTPLQSLYLGLALESPHSYDGHIIYYSNCTILRVKVGTSNNHVSMTGINQDCPGHTRAYGHPAHIQLPSGRSSGVLGLCPSPGFNPPRLR